MKAINSERVTSKSHKNLLVLNRSLRPVLNLGLLLTVTLSTLLPIQRLLAEPPSLGLNVGKMGEAAFGGIYSFTNLFNGSTTEFSSFPNRYESFAENFLGEVPATQGSHQYAEVRVAIDHGLYPPGDYCLKWTGGPLTDAVVAGDGVETWRWRGSGNQVDIGLRVNPSPDGITIRFKNPYTGINNPERIKGAMLKEQKYCTSNQVYTDEFIRSAKAFGTVRVMDWLKSNFIALQGGGFRNNPITAADVTPPDATFFTHTRTGVSVPVQCALARETGALLWFNTQFDADDLAIERLAQLYRDYCDVGVRVVLEHGNEPWNHYFQQYYYNRSRGINSYGPDPIQASLFYQAQRSLEVFGIFRREYGNRASEVFTVINLQEAVPYWADRVLSFVINGRPFGNQVNALAVAPYIDGGLGLTRNSNLSIDQLIEFGRIDIRNRINSNMQQHRALTNRYGIDLWVYETGQHMMGETTQMHKKAYRFNHHPRIGDLYLELLATLRMYITGPAVMYNHIEADGDHGMWGLMTHRFASTSARFPKYTATLQALSFFRPNNEIAVVDYAPKKVEVSPIGRLGEIISIDGAFFGDRSEYQISSNGTALAFAKDNNARLKVLVPRSLLTSSGRLVISITRGNKQENISLEIADNYGNSQPTIMRLNYANTNSVWQALDQNSKNAVILVQGAGFSTTSSFLLLNGILMPPQLVTVLSDNLIALDLSADNGEFIPNGNFTIQIADYNNTTGLRISQIESFGVVRRP